MAKNYIDNLSQEVTRGMAEKAANGVYPSRAPYGYRNNPTTRGIDLVPEEAAAVKRIFETYATDQYSLKDLRDQVMKSRLLPAPPSGYLSIGRIAKMLHNEFYVVQFSHSCGLA